MILMACLQGLQYTGKRQVGFFTTKATTVKFRLALKYFDERTMVADDLLVFNPKIIEM